MRRGRRKEKLAFALCLGLLGVLAGTAVVYRDDLTEAFALFRIRSDHLYVLQLVGQRPDSPWGRAARRFARAPEGKEFLAELFLAEVSRAGSWAPDIISRLAVAQEDWIVTWVDRDSTFSFCSVSVRSCTINDGLGSAERAGAALALLGKAGVEGLSSRRFPGVEFCFVQPERNLRVSLPPPREGLLVFRPIPREGIVPVLERKGRMKSLPPFVCLAVKSGPHGPRLVPLEEGVQAR